MPLDRRTLRELLASPLIDDARRRSLLVLVAAGDRARHALHSVSVSVSGARRRAEDHVVVELPAGALVFPGHEGYTTEVHLVAVGADETDHPVTSQLALRAQGVIAAPDHPRVLRAALNVRAGEDAVAAYHDLLARVFGRIRKEHGAHASTPPADEPEDAPPSVGTRRCELALLGVNNVTAQELLTALDRVMMTSRYRRCAHAGGGRDFVLLRGQAGAGLRIVDDRAGSATDLAVQLAGALDGDVLAATAVGEREFDVSVGETKTEISWTLSDVTATGTGAVFRDATTHTEVAPDLPLDEHVCAHIASVVFGIDPEAEGIAIHYERR